MHTLTARDCIRYGWETFKKRPWFFIGAIAVFLVVVIMLDSISDSIFSGTLRHTGIAVLINWVLQILASMGIVAFTLTAHDDLSSVSLRDLWHPYPFWKYVGTYLLLAIIVICGFVLLIVPGIIWAIMFGFATYIVIDRGRTPIEALKESARITKGHRWMLFRLHILSALIILLGFICLGVGVLVAMPVTLLAVVHAYRTLAGSAVLDAAPVTA